ncbi:hypothetical protein LguiA_022721 [Lonicera macranthoides]
MSHSTVLVRFSHEINGHLDRVIIKRASSVLLRQLFDLQNKAINMKDAIFRKGFEEVLLLVTDETRSWNLRTRRAACK